MNTAESTATVELACGKKSEDAHWENLLTYCKQGNIQAMFDEYAHLITNSLDADNNLVDNLHYTIASSMDVRTTIYTIDTFNAFKAKDEAKKVLFWNYYHNENAPEKAAWGQGLHRYITDEQAASILKDIVSVKKGKKDEALAQEFLERFCEINSIDISDFPIMEGALQRK